MDLRPTDLAVGGLRIFLACLPLRPAEYRGGLRRVELSKDLGRAFFAEVGRDRASSAELAHKGHTRSWVEGSCSAYPSRLSAARRRPKSKRTPSATRLSWFSSSLRSTSTRSR